MVMKVLNKTSGEIITIDNPQGLPLKEVIAIAKAIALPCNPVSEGDYEVID